MSNLKNVVKKNQIVVFVIPNKKYANRLEEIVIVVLSKLHKKICYVCLNKPYNTLTKIFEKKMDVKKLIFIDCVTGNTGKEKQTFFVSSPKALTELSIAITKNLKNTESILFDSLSTLLIYEKTSTVIRFIHFLVSEIRKSDKKCILLCLKEDTNTDLMKDLTMFVDKTVNLK